MPLSQWNLEWLDHNSQRNYPLAEDATGFDSTSSFQLPEDFIVEMDLPIHSAMDMNPAKFFIRQIVAAGTGYSIIVAYSGSEGVQDVASANIPKSSHTRWTAYALGGIEPFDDTVGKVTINKLSSIDDQPAGLWEFDYTGSRIEPDTVRPIIRGVQSLKVQSGTTSSQRFYGDIELVAGNNIQLTPVVVSSGVSKIIISALSDESLSEPCVCEGDAAVIPCIKTINGIPPTTAGEFNFIGDDCIEFTGDTNALRASDACCAPCCGCTELEAITLDLERFNQQRVNLEFFVNELQSSVTEMNMVVLGARLGDKGCITCE
jgi:hypothetical protein|tara:strand:- start:7108 stop:8061 length:954 start_codon:yes stop_codon:yes gene_type:complete